MKETLQSFQRRCEREDCVTAALFFLLALLLSAAYLSAQDDVPLGDIARKNRSGNTSNSSGARRTLTNEDVASPDPARNVEIPDVPNLVRCVRDVQCFLGYVDKGVPAFVTRSETRKPVNDAIVTSTVSWWTTGYTGETARLSFRIEDFQAAVREEVFKDRPETERKEREAKIAEAIAEFEKFRKEINVCNVPRKDLKTVLTSAHSSLMTIGPATNFGKACTGKMFEPGKSAAP